MMKMTGRRALIKGDAEEDFSHAAEALARAILARDLSGKALEIAIGDVTHHVTDMVRDLCAQHSNEYLASFVPFEAEG
jgi:hypothetical protein